MRPQYRRQNVAALGVFLVWAGSATAYTSIPELGVPEKMGFATYVGVGKITAIDDEPVQVRLHPKHNWEALILVADVQITRNIYGLEKQKTLRLGFWNSPLSKEPGKKPALSIGQEGLFFAVKHYKENFCVVVLPGGFIDKRSPDFDKESTEAGRCGELLTRPLDGLKAKEAGERFLTAFMLLARYNDPTAFHYNHPDAMQKDEPIDAEESKLILQALAETDWAADDPKTKWRPLQAYNRLGGQGGAPPPRLSGFDSPQELEAAKKWLHENAETYRISKLVPGAKADPEK